MGEQADHVPVLAVELQLHLRFVLLQVFRAHVTYSPSRPGRRIRPPPAQRPEPLPPASAFPSRPWRRPYPRGQGSPPPLRLIGGYRFSRAPRHGANGRAMLGTRPRLAERPQVLVCYIPLMTAEAIYGITLIELAHHPVSGDL